MRTLIQPPGTVSGLLPIPGCSGMFCDANANMRRTKSIIVDLPIHAKSNVTLTRVIASIPGVPSGTTTTPPLFIVGDKLVDNRPPPKSLFEYNERCGILPNVPACYTSNPIGATPPVGRVIADRPAVVKDMKMWSENDDVPKGASKIPLRADQDLERSTDLNTCPVGFSLLCPYSGYDTEKIDRTLSFVSPIYGRPSINVNKGTRGRNAVVVDRSHYQDYATVGGLENDKNANFVPDSQTLNRHSVLFPCKLP